MSTPNNNPKGILLILVGMAIFSIQDALIKFVFKDTAVSLNTNFIRAS